MKKFIFKIPEFYFVCIVVLAAYTQPFHFNPVLMGFAFIVWLQAIFNNKISGLLLGVLFFLANLYFLGALLSEFNEFETFGSKAKQLLFIGVLIWLLNGIFSLLMVYKYLALPSRKKTKLV